MAAVTRTETPFSYSAAVAAGDFVFLGLHRGFGEDFATQLDGALDGVAATLAGHGLHLHDLVKVHVWLRDIEDLRARDESVLVTGDRRESAERGGRVLRSCHAAPDRASGSG